MASTQIKGSQIRNGAIANAQIASDAAIALSKLATDPLARANHTGSQAASTISDLATTVKAYRLDEFANPTSAVAMNSQKLTGLANGTTSGDAVNYGQLLGLQNGTAWKDPVRVLANSNITLANTQTIDGVSLAAGDRVLVRGQSTASENGIYLVVDGGSWTRSTDLAAGASAVNVAMFVAEGTTYADTAWRCTSNADADTVGTNDLAFAQFGSGTSYSADGTTLSLSGTTFSVANGGVDTTQIADDAVTTAKIADSQVTPAKLSFSFVDNEVPSGTINGTNTDFTLASTPVSGSVHVYLNGIRQTPGVGNDYTISGTTITFAAAPVSGDALLCDYRA